MNTPIRILVADDHPIVRDGLISILGTQPDFDVVGKAGLSCDLGPPIHAATGMANDAGRTVHFLGPEAAASTASMICK